MSGAPNQDDLIDVSLVNLGISENLLGEQKSVAKEVLAQLEAGMDEGGVAVDTP